VVLVDHGLVQAPPPVVVVAALVVPTVLVKPAAAVRCQEAADPEAEELVADRLLQEPMLPEIQAAQVVSGKTAPLVELVVPEVQKPLVATALMDQEEAVELLRKETTSMPRVAQAATA